jgi:hypothetical protein
MERQRLSDSQALLAEVDATMRQFMYYPNEHAYTVNALWIAHTHLRDPYGNFLPQRTPRLYFGSKEAGAGKTMGMDLTILMSHKGNKHINPTQHALVTALNIEKGTNGIDECDRFFGTRGNSKADVQTAILAGYAAPAYVSRQRGDDIDWQNIHGPMVLAGKNLQRMLTHDCFETLRTRSIIVQLERKPPDATVDKYKYEIHEPRLRAISKRLAIWGERNAYTICSIDVQETMDKIGLDNRDEEIWSILFRIAKFVGGDWPRRIELAARAMVLGQWGEDETPIQSPAEELLMWVRAVITDDDGEFIPTRTIIERLFKEAPKTIWFRREWRNPMSASKGLADAFRIYNIEADRYYVTTEKQERGYWTADFAESEPTQEVDESVDFDSWDWSSVE